jgi:glycosyltransferase involved in cell wall biosynthesis
MNKAASSRRILLCLYSFPPIGGPRAIRWLHLGKLLFELGWPLDVLTVNPSPLDSFYDESLLKRVPPEIRIYRSYPGIYYTLIHLKSKPVRGFPKTTMEWFPFGLKKGLNLVKSRDYGVLISSGLPFVGHLVGYFLKRKSGIPWIMDYGDPFGFNPVTSITKRALGKPIEKHILKEADGLVVPCPEMGEDFLDNYPFLKSIPIRTVGNGISERFDLIPPSELKDKFVISYVGSFYKKDREPYSFFEALSLLRSKGQIPQNMSVVVAGNTEKEFIHYAQKLKIDDLVQFLGQIPYERAISILKGAPVTLYIGDRWSYHHIQYKILEIAASGRPIIAVRQSSADLGVEFVKDNNLGIIVSMDKEEIAQGIHQMYELWKRKALNTSFAHIRKDLISWDRKGKELEEFLLHILSNQEKIPSSQR